MACPYFFPTERFLGQNLWPHPARLPLGGGFTGFCSVDSGVEFRPDENRLTECCNLGYARRCCDRFPDGEAPDAVRFTVSNEQEGIIQIRYALEKDHLPCGHGALAYDKSHRSFVTPPADRVLQRQAEAYVESYLRRKLQL